MSAKTKSDASEVLKQLSYLAGGSKARPDRRVFRPVGRPCPRRRPATPFADTGTAS